MRLARRSFEAPDRKFFFFRTWFCRASSYEGRVAATIRDEDVHRFKVERAIADVFARRAARVDEAISRRDVALTRRAREHEHQRTRNPRLKNQSF